MSNKDRENKETGERDLRKRITVASVWVAASASDLIGNDISLANTVKKKKKIIHVLDKTRYATVGIARRYKRKAVIN